ncbi:HlyD family secretion protein [Solibacillus daqui]|uniref:HlyD family secretion protein n=1 Tax=Solibacillus daqui TaxID=2912187 RepID=UPI002365047E|nr:HlyD family secretion protein [Solibacillus daqui]
MYVSKKVKITGAIIAIVVLVNAYLLLRENDIILKKYYINDAHFAVTKDHEKILSTDAIVTSSNEQFIAAPVQAIDEVLVTEGQTVDVLGELVLFKLEETEKEIARLESDLAAYETELEELNSVVSQLEIVSTETNSTSATDSNTTRVEDILNLTLSIELGIEQGTPTVEGIAIIQRAIAETERQMELLSSRITQLSENNMLTSPVDGIVKEIVLEGDSIIFNIQSTDKKLVTYVTPKQWQEVEIDQMAKITLFKGQDNELTIDGNVIEKQQIPALESIGFQEMKKHEKINVNETVYEVSIQLSEDISDTPIGTLATADITVNEETHSLGVDNEWLVQIENEDDDKAQYIYMLDGNGNTLLQPVEKYFVYKSRLNQHEALTMDSKGSEELEETEQPTTPRIQTVNLKAESKSKVVKEELIDVAVISGPDELYPIFLDGTTRNLSAPTFLPYPLQSFELSHIESDWRLILKYWLK